jgi:hypothetical protein
VSPRVNWHCARGMTLASRHATLAIHQSAKLFDASMPAPVVSSLFDLHVAIRLPTHSVRRAPLSRFDHPRTRLVRARGESASQALTRSTSSPSPHDLKPPPGVWVAL